MQKDFINLLVARISKNELKKVHPDWLEPFGPIDFIKNEYKEILKDILIEQILKRAKEENYYIFSEIKLQETEHSFIAIALAYPKFVPGTVKKLRPPKLSPEEISEIFKKKIEELNIFGYSSQGFLISPQNNEFTTNSSI